MTEDSKPAPRPRAAKKPSAKSAAPAEAKAKKPAKPKTSEAAAAPEAKAAKPRKSAKTPVEAKTAKSEKAPKIKKDSAKNLAETKPKASKRAKDSEATPAAEAAMTPPSSAVAPAPQSAAAPSAKPARMAEISHEEAEALVTGRHGDPFSILGAHQRPGGWLIRAFEPGAETLEALPLEEEGSPLLLTPVEGSAGLFEGFWPGQDRPAYRLSARRGEDSWSFDDPYRFSPLLGQWDEYFLSEGAHWRLWEALGGRLAEHEGVKGARFAVWAPSAQRVSVVGEFNLWDGRRHAMRQRGATGVWEIFIPGLEAGAAYKYEIVGPDGQVLPLKADPLALRMELRPNTASLLTAPSAHAWNDEAWMARRGAAQALDAPISIYEVHLGSWRRNLEEGGRPLTYEELARQLVQYASWMGFTHLELLPITEHPFDGSWGYQPIGLYAPTSRYGTPDEFRGFVDACHQAGLGVILDWVPAHFPTDSHGLARFDGTALYEHADPREGYHLDWNTYIYNFGRREVANFLIANALYWLGEMRLDGLRVDAVASMLYRDYSRPAGGWTPNAQGGRENLEAVAFLKRLNETIYGRLPGVTTMAEESTSWPQVSRPTSMGGLGFGYKWNMGWMHDTLGYMSRDPIHRKHHHHQMTFGMMYAHTENFILPLSHDEVVHGKGSLLARMPGQGLEPFANLRAYYAFMWAYPGKKLLFMGGEFAQRNEWNADQSLDWHLTAAPAHAGVQRLVRDLNLVYRDTPALYERDCEEGGFAWLQADCAAESVYSFQRWAKDGSSAIALFNFTPVARPGWRVGVDGPGRWELAIDTDAAVYEGGGGGPRRIVEAEQIPANGRPWSLNLRLPGLSGLILRKGV